MYIRTIFEAFAVILLIAGFFAEDKLIAFEHRVASFAIECKKRLRRYLISVSKDASAIYRACRRQHITFFRFAAMLCKYKPTNEIEKQKEKEAV